MKNIYNLDVRTINDHIYGKGELVEKNAYIYNGHYRRFIDPEELMQKVAKIGFNIISSQEQAGFSKTETDDPVLLRLILKK